jgi:membrane protein involved in colicin uptake
MGLADPTLVHGVASQLGFSANEVGTIVEHYLEAEEAADKAAADKAAADKAAADKAKAEADAKKKAAQTKAG